MLSAAANLTHTSNNVFQARFFGPGQAIRWRQARSSFLKKKQQKNFARLASAFPDGLSPDDQKFFGSFFQKEQLSSFTRLPWV